MQPDPDAERTETAAREDMIDEAEEESFPASDPPASGNFD